MTDTELELIRTDIIKNLGDEYDEEDGFHVWEISETTHDLGDGHVAYFAEHINGPDSYYLTVVDGTVYGNEELDALRQEYDDDFLALERIRSAIKYVATSPLNHFKLTADQVDELTFNELAGHLQSLAADFRDAGKGTR